MGRFDVELLSVALRMSLAKGVSSVRRVQFHMVAHHVVPILHKPVARCTILWDLDRGNGASPVDGIRCWDEAERGVRPVHVRSWHLCVHEKFHGQSQDPSHRCSGTGGPRAS